MRLVEEGDVEKIYAHDLVERERPGKSCPLSLDGFPLPRANVAPEGIFNVFSDFFFGTSSFE